MSAGLGQVQTAPAMNGRREAQPGQQGSDPQAACQAVLPSFADGAEPSSAGLSMNKAFAKGVSEALKGVENGCCHLPCSDEHILSSLGLPPDPSFARPRSERPNGSKGYSSSTDTLSSGLAPGGCMTAAAAGSSGDHTAPCGSAAAGPGQAGRLPGPGGQPAAQQAGGPCRSEPHQKEHARDWLGSGGGGGQSPGETRIWCCHDRALPQHGVPAG